MGFRSLVYVEQARSDFFFLEAFNLDVMRCPHFVQTVSRQVRTTAKLIFFLVRIPSPSMMNRQSHAISKRRG